MKTTSKPKYEKVDPDLLEDWLLYKVVERRGLVDLREAINFFGLDLVLNNVEFEFLCLTPDGFLQINGEPIKDWSNVGGANYYAKN
jgi:hypothetical protein